MGSAPSALPSSMKKTRDTATDVALSAIVCMCYLSRNCPETHITCTEVEVQSRHLAYWEEREEVVQELLNIEQAVLQRGGGTIFSTAEKAEVCATP